MKTSDEVLRIFEEMKRFDGQKCLLFHSSLPDVVFVASDGGVDLSLHSGDSWQDLNRDFVMGDMFSLAVHGGLAVSNFDHQHVWGIHRFEGRTWELIGGNEFDRCHSHPDLPNRFYWGRNEGLYRLKRDGSRWTPS